MCLLFLQIRFKCWLSSSYVWMYMYLYTIYMKYVIYTHASVSRKAGHLYILVEDGHLSPLPLVFGDVIRGGASFSARTTPQKEIIRMQISHSPHCKGGGQWNFMGTLSFDSNIVGIILMKSLFS